MPKAGTGAWVTRLLVLTTWFAHRPMRDRSADGFFAHAMD